MDLWDEVKGRSLSFVSWNLDRESEWTMERWLLQKKCGFLLTEESQSLT